MKTILELSQEIGVSKTAVLKKLEKLGLKNKVAQVGNKILIDEKTETALKSAFNVSEKKQAKTNADFENLIQVLSLQLEEKDKQIKSLQTIIENQQKQIEKEQTLRILEAQQQLAIEQKQQKQSIFSRLFKRKGEEQQNDV